MSDVSVRFVHLLSGEFTSLQRGEALEVKCSAYTVCPCTRVQRRMELAKKKKKLQ